MSKRYWFLRRPGHCSLPCLYCGVDSGPALNFFIWMIGGGLLAFFCFYGWGLVNGKFGNDREVSRVPLEVENEEGNNHV